MTYLGLKTCPKCDGEGQLEYEFPVADYGAPHGGFLDTEWGDCDQCGGTGEIEDWEDEDE